MLKPITEVSSCKISNSDEQYEVQKDLLQKTLINLNDRQLFIAVIEAVEEKNNDCLIHLIVSNTIHVKNINGVIEALKNMTNSFEDSFQRVVKEKVNEINGVDKNE
jgi:hypothetical protein